MADYYDELDEHLLAQLLRKYRDTLDEICKCGWSCGPGFAGCGCDYCEDASNTTTTSSLITVWASYILIFFFILAMILLFKHCRRTRSDKLLLNEETV